MKTIDVTFYSESYLRPSDEWDAVTAVPRVGEFVELGVYDTEPIFRSGESRAFEVTRVMWTSPTEVSLTVKEVED